MVLYYHIKFTYNASDHRRAATFLWRPGGATIAGADSLAPFCVKFSCMRDIYVYFMWLWHIYHKPKQNGYKCQAVLCISPHFRTVYHYMRMPKIWIVCDASETALDVGFTNHSGLVNPLINVHTTNYWLKKLFAVILFSDFEDDLNNLSWNPYKVFSKSIRKKPVTVYVRYVM